jgi:hypothetical protein
LTETSGGWLGIVKAINCFGVEIVGEAADAGLTTESRDVAIIEAIATFLFWVIFIIISS